MSLYRRIAHGRFDLVVYCINGALEDPLEACRLQLLPAKRRLLVNSASGAGLPIGAKACLRIILNHPNIWIRQMTRCLLRLIYRRMWDPMAVVLWRLLPVILEPIFRLTGRRPRRSLQDVRKILFMALDNPGDVLLTTPVLSALKEIFPSATLAVLAGEWNTELLEHNPSVSKVITYNAPWFAPYVRHLPHAQRQPIPDFFRVFGVLWRERFDMTVETRGEAAHVAFSYVIGAPYRVGYCLWSVMPWLRSDHVSHLLTHRVDYAWDRWGQWHRVDVNLQVARALGVRLRNSDLVLPSLNGAQERMEKFLRGHRMKPEALLIGVHPGASQPRKRWPVDRFAHLLDAFIERWDAEVILLGSDQEEALGATLRHLMQHPPIWAIGSTTLLEAASLIQQCHLLICNDSVMTHLASAVKTPVVALSRFPSSFYAPYHTEGIALTKKLPCMNRGLPDGCNCPFSEYWCLQEVTPEEVLGAAEHLLAGRIAPSETHADRD